MDGCFGYTRSSTKLVYIEYFLAMQVVILSNYRPFQLPTTTASSGIMYLIRLFLTIQNWQLGLQVLLGSPLSMRIQNEKIKAPFYKYLYLRTSLLLYHICLLSRHFTNCLDNRQIFCQYDFPQKLHFFQIFRAICACKITQIKWCWIFSF